MAGPRMPSTDRRRLCALIICSALVGCRASDQDQPKDTSRPKSQPAHPGGLVDLAKLDSAIRLDIRYATPNNFTGRRLYDTPRAFLVQPAAQALLRAHRAAQAEGFGFTIFDAYRPWRITKALWDATPPGPKKNYVANPKKGSRHNRGCAVDLTLHDLKTGQQVEMPSGYDEFSPRAHRNFMGASPAAIANRRRLERYMEVQGFRGMSNEWWHFDFAGWQDFPLLDIAFEEIG